MINELLEVGIHLLAGLIRPNKLVARVKDEGQLVHLSLIEGMGDGVDVGSVDPHMAGDAAQPLPSIFSAHVLVLRHRLSWQ